MRMEAETTKRQRSLYAVFGMVLGFACRQFMINSFPMPKRSGSRGKWQERHTSARLCLLAIARSNFLSCSAICQCAVLDVRISEIPSVWPTSEGGRERWNGVLFATFCPFSKCVQRLFFCCSRTTITRTKQTKRARAYGKRAADAMRIAYRLTKWREVHGSEYATWKEVISPNTMWHSAATLCGRILR